MDRDAFREALLAVMECKHHWSEPAFGDGLVPKVRLHMHLEQEYETYVRDFPLLLGRAYAQCPIPAVRRELAENLYEEETGESPACHDNTIPADGAQKPAPAQNFRRTRAGRQRQ